MTSDAFVIVVEPAYAGHSLVERCARAGHRLALITADRDDRVLPAAVRAHADEIVVVDTNDTPSVVAAAQVLAARRPVAAVLPGFEYYVPAAAAAGRALGLPALSEEAARAVRYKHHMRRALADAGVRVPRFHVMRSPADVDRAIAEVSLPCVVKPVDFAGSIGVRKATTREEAVAAFEELAVAGLTDFGRTSRTAALAEEYIAGPEFSVEGYVDAGAVSFLSITEKFLCPEPFFVEAGHIVNVPVDEARRAEIEGYVRRMLEALGVTLGPFHAELRIDAAGPALMEVGARLPGDRICDLIELATGVDLSAVMLACCMGTPAPGRRTRDRVAGVRYFLRDLSRVSRVDGVDDVVRELAPQELQIYFAPGTTVPDTVDYIDRFGHVIMVDDDYARLRRALDEVDRRITIA